MDVIMPMYNLIECRDNYSKISESLWRYYRDEPPLTDAGAITSFHAADHSDSFKFKQKIIAKTAANGIEDFEIAVPWKYLHSFWRTLEMPLINCEISLILTWSDKCVLSNDTKAITFAITDTKLYVPVATL